MKTGEIEAFGSRLGIKIGPRDLNGNKFGNRELSVIFEK